MEKCCPGYQEDKNSSTCVPVLCADCVNGICIEANKCLCSDGFIGPTCNTSEWISIIHISTYN